MEYYITFDKKYKYKIEEDKSKLFMEKKATIIYLLFVIAIVISAVVFIIFSGITAKDYNYVQLEVNPRIEFICDKYFNVISARPINDDAKILLAEVNYKGMDVDDASVDFIDLCAKAGYIDVDGDDNAVNITVIDGITQALDVHVTQGIYKYLQQKEILCTVVENYEDRSMFDQKKENNICCANKYKLMKTIQEYDTSKSIETLNKLSEESLIDMVANIHQSSPYSPTEDNITLKTKLIDFNREKYDKHMQSINNESRRKFAEKFDKHQKDTMKKYATNFTKEYSNWQKQQIS